MRFLLLRAWKILARGLVPFGLNKIPLMRNIHYWVVRWVKKDSVILFGHRLTLDPHDSLNLSHEPYEPLAVSVFVGELEPGTYMVDVGANIGYYTLLGARGVGSRGRVHAFEPEPVNRGLLVRNIDDNGYRNVRVDPRAVSDHPGKAIFHASSYNSGNHRLYPEEGDAASYRVNVTSLDRCYRKREKRIGFVKMDIQGGEMAALRGMKHILRRNRRIKIMLEFWPYGLDRMGEKAADLLALLKRFGFKLYDIDEVLGRLTRAEPRTLLARYTVRNLGSTNLLCIHGSPSAGTGRS